MRIEGRRAGSGDRAVLIARAMCLLLDVLIARPMPCAHVSSALGPLLRPRPVAPAIAVRLHGSEAVLCALAGVGGGRYGLGRG